MVDILSIDPIEKSPTLNLIKKTWGQLNSLDKFTKLMVISVSLFVISTPFIVANRQVLISRGQTATSITAAPLTTGSYNPPSGQEANTAVVTTPTVTIGANKLALIWVTQGNGTAGTASLSDTNRTWTQISTNTPGLRRLTLYRSMNLVETTGAITITSQAPSNSPDRPNEIEWSLVEYSNTDTSGTNGTGAIVQFAARNYQNAGGNKTLSGSIMLGTSSQNASAVAGGFARGITSGVSPGTGYTLTGGSPCITICVQAEFRDNFAEVVDMSWSSSVHWMVIAAELKPLSGAIPTPTSSVPTPTPPDSTLTPTPTLPPNLTPTPTPVITSASISAASVTIGNFRAGSGGGASTGTTNSVTISANKLALVWVAQVNGNGGPATLSDPNRSWTQVTTNTAGLRRISLYRSMNTADTTGPITIKSPASSSTEANSLLWSVVEYSNTDKSGTNGSGAIAQFASRNYKDAGGARSLSGSVNLLPSSLVGSAVVGGFAKGPTTSLFSGAGYTLTGGSSCTSTLCVQAEFRDNFAQLVNMNWSSIVHWLVIAAELKASP